MGSVCWAIDRSLYDTSHALQGQCTFTARLTDEQVKEAAEYVLLRAEQGWQ